MPLNEAQLAFAAWQAEEEKARQQAVEASRWWTWPSERIRAELPLLTSERFGDLPGA